MYYVTGIDIPGVLLTRGPGEGTGTETIGDDGQREGQDSRSADRLLRSYCTPCLQVSLGILKLPLKLVRTPLNNLLRGF